MRLFCLFHHQYDVFRMEILRTDNLIPPKGLIQHEDSVIVVSAKRPVCIYFDKAMALASKRIIQASTGSVVEVKITGAGGAISRCEQVVRYTIQTIQDKFRHMIRSVEKVVSSVGETEVTDLVIPAGVPKEIAELEISAMKRPVRTMMFTIKIVIS